MDIRESIIEDRLRRSDRIQEIVLNTNNCVVSIKANIVGNDKNIKEAKLLINYFFSQVTKTFDVNNYEYHDSFDGAYYILELNNADFLEVKKGMISLEMSLLGRFIDLDVFSNRSYSISRSELGFERRRCIVCGDDYGTCLGLRKHSVDEVLSVTKGLIRKELVQLLTNYTVEAMQEEVSADPKLGLVTRHSNGAHTDMNIDTFTSSIEALKPYITEYLIEGFDISDNTFGRLRKIGLDAEKAMFTATKGINTHKGAVFLLGFLLPTFMDILINNKSISEASDSVKILAKDILRDFENLEHKATLTYGEKLYLEYGITGVRGVVFDGLQILFKNLNELKELEIYSGDEYVIRILLLFMKELDDTTLLHRHPIEVLFEVKEQASKLYNNFDIVEVNKVTKEYIERRISPGGAADLTILSLFVLKVLGNFNREVL